MGAAFSHASPTDVSARKALSACSYLLRPYVHWEEFGRHLQVEVITRDRSSPESRVWELFLHCPAPCLLLPERECSSPSTGCKTDTLLGCAALFKSNVKTLLHWKWVLFRWGGTSPHLFQPVEYTCIFWRFHYKGRMDRRDFLTATM